MPTLRRVQLRVLHHEELVCHVDLGPGGGGRVGGLRRDSDDRTGQCVRHVVGKALDTADEDVLALVPLFVEVGEAAYELGSQVYCEGLSFRGRAACAPFHYPHCSLFAPSCIRLTTRTVYYSSHISLSILAITEYGSTLYYYHHAGPIPSIPCTKPPAITLEFNA